MPISYNRSEADSQMHLHDDRFSANTNRDAMRPEQEIFDELAALCVTSGYIHAIAHVCTRDNMIQYDQEIKPEDLHNLHGYSRLVRTEIMSLLGLLVKQEVDYALPTPTVMEVYLTKTESLLEETHNAMLGDFMSAITSDQASDPDHNPFTFGRMLR